MFLDYLKSIIIIITSILLSLMLAEFLLFSIGKYSNLVNSNFNNSNTVWENKPLSLESMSHPDLGIRIFLQNNYCIPLYIFIKSLCFIVLDDFLPRKKDPDPASNRDFLSAKT